MTIVPIGFGVATLTFSTTGSPHNSQITFGFNDEFGGTPANINAVLWNALSQTGKPFQQTNMSTEWAITQFSTFHRRALGGDQVVDFFPSAWVGQAGTLPIPMNSAFIVNKNTGQAGRKFKGRMFVPPCGANESAVNGAGIIDSATLSTQNGKWAAFQAQAITGFVELFLLHNDATAPTEILTLPMSNKVGTLKRRLRS